MRAGNTGWPYLLRRALGHHVRDRVRDRARDLSGRRVRHPLTTSAELAAAGAARRLVVHPAAPAPLRRPGGLPEPLWRSWCAGHVGESAEQVVLDVRGATVVSGFGWVFASGRLVADLWQERVRSAPRLAAHVRADGPAVHLEGTTASLLAPWAQNYYHWTVQGVPRVGMLAAAADLAEVDHWLVPPHTHPYLGEWLDLLGVPRAARVEVSGADRRFTTERLLVSSVPAAGYNVPPWVVDDVRQRVAPSRVGGGPALLFVDRPDTGRRRLINREQVLRAVRERGFTVVHLEDAHLAEEVSLFASARVVVGVHGAGLTNALHCPPGAHLVEITPTGLSYPTFHKLAAVAGLHHHVLPGTEPALPGALAFLDNQADVVADVAALRRLLDRLVPVTPRVGGGVL
ncbi:glycosyltransferase family 61 protein [Kineococcus esterisolvens]|uniref:glycosyltransferase family 61 protein n=1 Tax=unclassified Kineococcus TaxID=2621656 RepID=UPI003D7F0C04